MIRKIVIAALCLIPVVGQAQTVEHFGLASQFNNWQANAQSGPYSNNTLVAGANTVSVNPCSVQGDPNHQIPVFAASTPVRIVDLGTPSLTETVTPSTVTNGGCTATFTTTNAHGSNYIFKSGTFGLQEAINAYAQTGALNVIELDTVSHAAGGGSLTLYNAAGNANVNLTDVTLAPSSTYRWNGSHYLSSYTYNAGSVTAAAGAAAGTSPTIANSGNATANIMTVSLTTGTSPTTGTLFTETFGTAYPTGGANCVVASVGANPGPPVTATATSTTVETFSVAVAPTASLPYVYNISCN